MKERGGISFVCLSASARFATTFHVSCMCKKNPFNFGPRNELHWFGNGKFVTRTGRFPEMNSWLTLPMLLRFTAPKPQTNTTVQTFARPYVSVAHFCLGLRCFHLHNTESYTPCLCASHPATTPGTAPHRNITKAIAKLLQRLPQNLS